MRQIKFRAWDTFNELMVYEPYYFRVRQSQDSDDDRFNAPYEYAEHWQDVDDGVWRPCHIMQFTGLLDRNGKEIFEGDVVTGSQYIYIDNGVQNYVGVIVFGDSAFLEELRCVNPAKAGISDMLCESMEDMEYKEIIGNIHENPELIRE